MTEVNGNKGHFPAFYFQKILAVTIRFGAVLTA